jgi:hypothetical protein
MDYDASNGVTFTDCGAVTGANPTVALTLGILSTHTVATASTLDVDYMRTWQDDAEPGLEVIAPADASTIEVVPETTTEATTTPVAFNSKLILADLLTNLDPEVANGAMAQRLDTGRMVAGVEIVSPKITTDKLYANMIESPTLDAFASSTEMMFGRLGILEGLFNSQSSSTATTSVIQNGLAVSGGALFNGGLIVDTIGTTGVTMDMLGDITFYGRPYFTGDTAGSAVILKGTRSVEIVFDREYMETPIVSTEIALEEASSTDEFSESIFNSNIRSIVTKKGVKGFTILLNKPSTEDISFSWIALPTKNQKMFTSKLNIPADVPISTTVSTTTSPVIEAALPIVETIIIPTASTSTDVIPVSTSTTTEISTGL